MSPRRETQVSADAVVVRLPYVGALVEQQNVDRIDAGLLGQARSCAHAATPV